MVNTPLVLYSATGLGTTSRGCPVIACWTRSKLAASR